MISLNLTLAFVRTCLRWLALCGIVLLGGLSASGQTAPFRNEWIDYNKTYYRFPVAPLSTAGSLVGTNRDAADYQRLHRIPYTSLMAAGLHTVPAEHLQLWRNGKEVAIYTFPEAGLMGPDGFIEFWGDANDGLPDTDLFAFATHHTGLRWNMFSDTAMHYLTVNAPGPNKRLQNIAHDPLQSSLQPEAFFMHTITINPHSTRNLGFARFISGREVRSSAFEEGEGWSEARFGSDSFTIRLGKLFADFSSGQTISIVSSMQGSAPAIPFLQAKLNDSLVGMKQFGRYRADSIVVNNIALSRINSNDSTNFVMRMQAPSSSYRFFLKRADFRYPRKFQFQKDTRHFQFTLPASSERRLLKLVDFDTSHAQKLLLDLTNNRRYTGVVVADTVWFELESSLAQQRLILTSYADNPVQVNQLVARNFVDFSQPNQRGDFLIISNSRLYQHNGSNPVEAYRNYRQSSAGGNYQARVYDIDELTEQFAFGIYKHPLAVRNFLRYARQNFGMPIKAALLLGRGATYDFNPADTNIARLNLVPTWGNPASDNLLAAENSQTIVPATIIGRVAAITGEEVQDYLDKLTTFESIQANAAASKLWQKQALHLIGGTDAVLIAPIKANMSSYENTIRGTRVGASVQTFIRNNNPNTSADNDAIQKAVTNGVGLLSYFGHSSATSFDFNLNSPEELTMTEGRFPVFLANGCKASEFFDLNTSRYNQRQLTLSERFVLSKQAGSIAFLSSTHYGILQYLGYFGEEWYKALSVSRYGGSVGAVHQEAIAQTLSRFGYSDFQARITAEEFHLHGDPVVKMYTQLLPDYAIEASDIQLSPTTPGLVTDTIRTKIRIRNLGAAPDSAVRFMVKRRFPDGSLTTLADTTLVIASNEMVYPLTMVVKSSQEAGSNALLASINLNNGVTELSTENNTDTLLFTIANTGSKPISPVQFGIVGQWPTTLVNHSMDAKAPVTGYRLQIDTTTLFNSPLLHQQDTTAAGLHIGFWPANTLLDSTVYYWRVAPLQAGVPGTWSQSSFTYMAGSQTGFNQQHYYQHQQSTLTGLEWPSASRELRYAQRNNNIYVLHSVYPTSGTEDLQFSVTPNGNSYLYSACVGRSIIFNVFDSLSFVPWRNATPGLFGSAGICGGGREHNFEFPYYPASNRKKIMDFLDAIPTGNYVVARLNIDPDPGQPGYPAGKSDSAYTEYWKRDTLIYGSGNSLYHKLLEQGAYDIDSNNSRRNFVFVFRKNDTTSYKPVFKLSQGLYDANVVSTDFAMTDTVGTITSPWVGPAASWQSLHWRALSQTEPNGSESDTVALMLRGKRANGQIDTLYTFKRMHQDAVFDNDSAIDASQYPYLQMHLVSSDADNATPYPLRQWRIMYTPRPDGSIAPLEYLRVNKDSGILALADTLQAATDTLFAGIAFRNTGTSAFTDSISYRLILEDSIVGKTTLASGNIRPLGVNDSAQVTIRYSLKDFGGKASLHMAFNPERPEAELTLANNFYYANFYIIPTPLASPPNLRIFTGTGLWSDSARWTPFGLPVCTDKVIIRGHSTVDIANAVSDTLLIEDTGSLQLLTDTAKLVVGCGSTGGNKPLWVWGKLRVDSGLLHINGGLLLADSSVFWQHGGQIVLDPNTNDSATSLRLSHRDSLTTQRYMPAVLSFGGGRPDMDSTLRYMRQGQIWVTGGTISMVDPPWADSVYSLYWANSDTMKVHFGGSHTLWFGKTSPITDSSRGQGFVVHQARYGGTGTMVWQHVVVANGPQTHRAVWLTANEAILWRIRGLLEIKPDGQWYVAPGHQLQIGPDE